MTTVALVSATPALGLDDDLPLVAAALQRLGLDSAVVVWDDPAVDWAAFDLAVVRSTWDYAPRRPEFLAWAEETAGRTQLLNPPAVLAWSTDKRYLVDLTAAGVPTVPTQWLNPHQQVSLRVRGGPDDHQPKDFMVGEGGGAVVVKPVVGAGSVGAGRFDGTTAGLAAAAGHIAKLLAERQAVMVQPYLDAIDHAGETAIVYIDGEFSHVVTKAAILRPEGAAFIEGGLYADERMEPTTATAAERAVADAAVAAAVDRLALTEPLLYARVDLVPGADGQPVVLELELAEPSLFLAYADNAAADRLAAAIARRLTASSR